LTTSDARSSGERLDFIQGCELPPDCATPNETTKLKVITKRKERTHNFWDGLCRGIELPSMLYKIDIVAGFNKFPRKW
jgi:hypothetical protein